MKRKPAVSSLRVQIILVVVISMSLMLIFQGISMGRFAALNNQRRYAYTVAANENIAASLNTMGENIRSIASYIASLEAFKNLYFPSRAPEVDIADTVSAAFQTVRFIAGYYPIIHDVAVVGLNSIPFSYYTGYGYEFVELIGRDYDFYNENAVESRFFYFEGKDFFIYAAPISGVFSTVGDNKKIATCIFICDLVYVRELLTSNAGDQTVHFSVFDRPGNLVASGGGGGGGRPGENREYRADGILSRADNMGLTVAAYMGPAGMAAGRGETTRFIRVFFVVSGLLLVLTTVMVIILLRIRIARPVSDLVNAMENLGARPLRARLENSPIDEIDHIVKGVNTLLDEVEAYTKKSIAAQEKLYEMELRKNEAEVYALQSQINPHFLNNTLQCIRSIAIVKGAGEIADISLAMSELFRYSMNYEDHVFVREEIDIVRHYIVITNIRFRNRFEFVFNVPRELYGRRMRRMILQPLVENAVRHGVSKQEDGGRVEILGSVERDIIRFEVIDNGPGFGEDRLEEIRRELARSFAESRERHKGGSFGLYNINRRLKLNYGEDYGLEIGRRNNSTLVRISFPDTG